MSLIRKTLATAVLVAGLELIACRKCDFDKQIYTTGTVLKEYGDIQGRLEAPWAPYPPLNKNDRPTPNQKYLLEVNTPNGEYIISVIENPYMTKGIPVPLEALAIKIKEGSHIKFPIAIEGCPSSHDNDKIRTIESRFITVLE